ncbi:MAG: hypothetical protein KDD34_01930, partial [Bdellovibrionales bacterium]|nr:hypothetical protein [Bdellovibrionales bacterium]
MLILFPKTLDYVDSRGVALSAVQIMTDKLSPAYVALQDVRANMTAEANDFLIGQDWGQVTLNAGGDTEALFEKLHNYEKVENKEIKEKDAQLNGLVISQTLIQNKDLLVAQEVAAPKGIDQVELSDTEGQLYPLHLRKQKILAAAKGVEFKQESLSQKAQTLVNQELRKAEYEKDIRWIQSQMGSQIFVAKEETVSRHPQRNVHEEKKETPPASNAISALEWKDANQRPLLLSGSIIFTDGLAYTGSDILLSISRVFDGETKESGKIWLRDARFEIPVAEAKGYLIAEMHSASGILLAHQEYDLSQIENVPSNETKVTHINIRLMPVQDGVIVKVISGYSYEDKVVEVKDAKVSLEPFGSYLEKDDDGRFVEGTLSKGSDIIIKAEAKDHWPTLARVAAGAVATVRVFHNNMIKALVDIMSESDVREENQERGIVWGLVTLKGKPLEGAVVEASGVYSSIAYMNSLYLPDVSLTQTSKNGTFAIIGAQNDLVSVRVNYKGQQFPGQVVRVQDHHVSYLEVEFGEEQSVRLKVVDEWNQGKAIDTSIQALGSDVVIDGVSTEQDLKTIKADHAFHFFEADAGLEYEMIRREESLRQHFIKFPLVQRVWLQKTRAHLKVSDSVNKGTIVGFVSQKGFDVFLNNGEKDSELVRMFFNSQGVQIEDQNQAVGFI